MSELEPPQKPAGLVCTFYSYKGGVGRSMALANVGVLMAAEGHRVLLVDWDLEAPGLEVFFQNAATLRGDPSATPGVVDLLEAQARGTRLDWRECLLKAEFFGHSLDVLSAGRRTDDYRQRVQQLNWDTLFREHRIGNYIDSLREDWRREYDFVLVDSRTGVTDIGDICTVILPDVLVFLFITNYQNVNGVKSVMARAVEARSKLPVNRSKLLAVPVPARDERYHDYDKSVEWQRIFAAQFNDLYREWLPKDVDPNRALNQIFLPYVSGWSFGERIPVIESERERADPTSLGAAYARLATLLSHRLDWSAVEAKTSAADAAGARVELSKAREEARVAEARLEQAQKVAALSKRRTRILAWVSSVLFLLAAGGGYWWYVTHPTPERLGARLSDSDPTVRADAARGLGVMGAVAVPYVPAIGQLLKDPDSFVRWSALSAFVSIGIWNKESISRFAPDVANLLEDSDTLTRAYAARALGEMEDAGVKFAPGIARLLKDEDPFVRYSATWALGNMGKAVAVFAPQVWMLRDDEDARVRSAAAEALDEMGGYTPPDPGEGGRSLAKGSADGAQMGKAAADAAKKPVAEGAPAAATPAKPAKEGGSIDDLLDQVGTKKAGGGEEPKPKRAPAAALPALSQSDIVSAMKAVQPKVKECFNQYKVPGIANVWISVVSGGRVGSATVTGKFAGTPSGTCVENAAKTAKFPPCEPMSFPWPFQLH